jgi:hypothetical protein
MPRCTSQWEDYKFQDNLWSPERYPETQFYWDVKNLSYTQKSSASLAIAIISDRTKFKRDASWVGGSGMSVQTIGNGPRRLDDGSCLWTGGVQGHVAQLASGMSCSTFTIVCAGYDNGQDGAGDHCVSIESSTDAAAIIFFHMMRFYVRNATAGGPTFGGYQITDPSPTYGTWLISSVTFNGSTMRLYKNGVQTATVGGISGSFGSMDRISINTDWGGSIFSYLIGGYGGICMTTDITKREIIEGHLAWRYGLQGSLNHGHKWSARPPLRGDTY